MVCTRPVSRVFGCPLRAESAHLLLTTQTTFVVVNMLVYTLGCCEVHQANNRRTTQTNDYSVCQKWLGQTLADLNICIYIYIYTHIYTTDIAWNGCSSSSKIGSQVHFDTRRKCNPQNARARANCAVRLWDVVWPENGYIKLQHTCRDYVLVYSFEFYRLHI